VDEAGQDDSRVYLRHAIATLAYRGGKVLRGVPDGFGAFDPGHGTRTPAAILAHVCDLLDWASSFARGQEVWQDSEPGRWDDDVNRFHAALRTLDDDLSRPGAVALPWARVFQGPIADALTHIGQLALLRRMAGFAVRGENYFRAEIVPGRVGPEQAAPRREFD